MPLPQTHKAGRYAPKRHDYEMFLDKRPCWLYYDFEFPKGPLPLDNPSCLASSCLAWLDELPITLFNSSADPEVGFGMDSCTAEKWSRHVVINHLMLIKTLTIGNTRQAKASDVLFVKILSA